MTPTGAGSGASGRIVVVGASLAGMNAAQALRRGGYEGDIAVVGEEGHQPYDRPPLSKEFLTGDVDPDRLVLAPVHKADELGIDLVLGRRAVSLDPGRSAISTVVPDDFGTAEAGADTTESLTYDGLIIATGSRARTLPADLIDNGAADLSGLFTLRTLNDARALKQAMADATEPVLVCGAGFIGGEVAASARSLGHDVILVEAAEAPLTRVLDAEAGLVMAHLHRRHGVDVRLGVSITAVHHDANQVRSVSLSDGSEIATSVVVVGIGAVPNTEWLTDSGLTIDNGVVVDEGCRAAPTIVAAGDVARFPNRRFGGAMMRVEQWDNAVEMGRFAATSLLSAVGVGDASAASAAYAPVPWFWSDQYDRKIQLAGVRSDDAVMAQGSLGDGQFVRLYHDDDSLCGVLCWNRPRQAIIGRQLIGQEISLGEAVERLGA